jgi:hypothetical protein
MLIERTALLSYARAWALSAREFRDTGDEEKTFERMLAALEQAAEKRGLERAALIADQFAEERHKQAFKEHSESLQDEGIGAETVVEHIRAAAAAAL